MGGKTSVNAVGTSRHRLRIGQYQTTAINHVRTTYFDNVRIGSSYAAVDPARNRDDTTTTPPVVTTVVPGAGSTGTDVAKDVIVTFLKPMNRTTAQSAFSLRKAATTTNVSGTFSWNSESTVMTFNPGANLAAATTYNVALSTAAQDVAGNAMAAAFGSIFTTDAIAPTVVALVPAPASTGVHRNTNVVVTFSEPMNRTAARSAFSLRKGGTTTNVSGTFSWNSGSTVMTFNPSADLAAKTTYSVALSTAAQDVAGNRMAAAFGATFRTR